jgi:tetratricopeptide (TPR) repeat protein/pimeloyl-ACP methyl ester carboxylesterase
MSRRATQRAAASGLTVVRLRAAVAAIAIAALASGLVNARAADLDRWARCMGQGGPALAIKECTAIIESGKELADSIPYAYLYRGEAHATLKETASATEDFTAALKFEPQLAHAHFGLGLLAREREDWPRAVAEFGKAAESASEDADVDNFTADSEGQFRAEALTERGYAVFKSGDAVKALADYEAAKKICPTCSAPYRHQAIALMTEQKYPEAMAAADRAIALNPRSALAFLFRGFVEAHMARYDRAVSDYSEAIRLLPTFALAYKARIVAYRKLGKAKESAADEKIVTLLRARSAEALLPALAVTKASTQASAAPTLDDTGLRALFPGKAWEARQGPWLATLEFRADGGFRQHAKDQSEGSNLEVVSDGSWSISRGQLCVYTNVALCMTGHAAGGEIALTRVDSEVPEYSGLATKLTDLKGDAANFPVAEFPVDELLVPGGSGAAGSGKKTLLYYIHGFEGVARTRPPLPQYFVDAIRKSEGWDLIDAAYPRTGVAEIMRFEGSNFGAAAYVARRIRELKAKGYERIFVGGQSWGGFTALALAMLPDLPLDGVILVVPTCCGWKSGGANSDDPNYANNKLLFDQMIERVRYPTVGIFFTDDEYEPADRGKHAAEVLTKHGIPNLMINHPPGFSGHGSAWFPVFDYVYRRCIVSFLSAPKTRQCPRRAIAASGRRDFRAILTAGQLGNWNSKTATLAELGGRQFAVYPDGDLRKIIAAGRTEVKGYGLGKGLFASSFRGDTYCVRARVKYNQPQSTDEVCAKLVKWSDHQLLALDAQSGNVVQWWIEHP